MKSTWEKDNKESWKTVIWKQVDDSEMGVESKKSEDWNMYTTSIWSTSTIAAYVTWPKYKFSKSTK